LAKHNPNKKAGWTIKSFRLGKTDMYLKLFSGNHHRGSFGSCYSYGMTDSCDKSDMNCSNVPEEPAWQIVIC
tara:strand:+ start:154 stop:369 length:216 start_codon:yes stop_codon:yes gene_type:complete